MCVIAAFPARTGRLAPNALARQGPAAAARGRSGFDLPSKSLPPQAAAERLPGRDALRGVRRAAPLHRRRLAWRRWPLLDPFAVPARQAWGGGPRRRRLGRGGSGPILGPRRMPWEIAYFNNDYVLYYECLVQVTHDVCDVHYTHFQYTVRNRRRTRRLIHVTNTTFLFLFL